MWQKTETFNIKSHMAVDEKFYAFGEGNYETLQQTVRHNALTGWKIGKGPMLY